MSREKQAKKQGRQNRQRHLILGGLLIAAAVLGVLWKMREPAPLPIPYCTAESIAILDVDSGRFLYEKESGRPSCPASLAKLMTMLVVLDHMEAGDLDWETSCVVTEEDVDTPGSVWGLCPGETWSIRQLAAGALLSSGCDCVQCLVRLCGGTENFVAEMNEKAEALELAGTHFTTATGLDEAEQYTTARDMAALCREVVEQASNLLEFTSQAELEIDGRVFRNTNRFIGEDPRVLGLKTGTSEMGGNHLAIYAQAEGKRYIVTLLGSNDGNSRYVEMMSILDVLFPGDGS